MPAGQQPESSNTRRAYEAHWNAWITYTRQTGIPPHAGTEGNLAGFVRWMSREGVAPSTAQQRVSGVRREMQARTGTAPQGDTAGTVRAELEHYPQQRDRNTGAPGRGHAPALTASQVRSISVALPDTLAGARDRAMLLLGFALRARRGDLAALRVEDVQQRTGKLWVRIPGSETVLAVAPGQGPSTCPVQAWRAWVAASGIAAGAAFRRVDRHGNLSPYGLTGQAVGQAIARAGQLAGVRITGDSLRAAHRTDNSTNQ